MKRKTPWRTAPPYEELRRLFVDEGWSHRRIAAKFTLSEDGVYVALKTGARRVGDPWPLQHRRTVPMVRPDTVDTMLLLAEIHDLCAFVTRLTDSYYGLNAFAREADEVLRAEGQAGVRAVYIRQIDCGFRPRVTRTTVSRLMYAIEVIEARYDRETLDCS